MVIIRNLLVFLIYFLFLAEIWNPLHAQDQRHGWNGVIARVISPEVSIIREGSSIPLYKWGMTLFEKDEVQTGERGRAAIRFSSTAKGNEITLGPSTRVRVFKSATNFDHSVYRVTVIEGKIWVTDRPAQSRKVQVSAGMSKIIPLGGEYVVEQLDEQTLTASISGNVKIHDKSTNRYSSLLPGEIASVSHKTGDLILKQIPEQLLADFSSTSVEAGRTAQQIVRILEGKEEMPSEPVVPVEEEPVVSVEENPLVPVEEEPVIPVEDEPVVETEATVEADKPTDPAVLPVAAGSDTTKEVTDSLPASPEGDKMSEPEPEKPVAAEPEKKGDLAPEKTAAETQQASEPDGEKSVSPEKKPDEEPEATTKPEQSAVVEKPEETEPDVSKVPEIQKKKEESFWLKHRWHFITTSTALIFAYLATDEAAKYNDLVSENESLSTQWESATTTSEQTSYEVQYEVNKTKMSNHKTNVDRYNLLSLIALSLEGYLLYDTFFGDNTDSARVGSAVYVRRHFIKPDKISFRFSSPSSSSTIRLSANWKW